MILPILTFHDANELRENAEPKNHVSQWLA